jgi:hypothetical protein
MHTMERHRWHLQSRPYLHCANVAEVCRPDQVDLNLESVIEAWQPAYACPSVTREIVYLSVSLKEVTVVVHP